MEGSALAEDCRGECVKVFVLRGAGTWEDDDTGLIYSPADTQYVLNITTIINT